MRTGGSIKEGIEWLFGGFGEVINVCVCVCLYIYIYIYHCMHVLFDEDGEGGGLVWKSFFSFFYFTEWRDVVFTIIYIIWFQWHNS